MGNHSLEVTYLTPVSDYLIPLHIYYDDKVVYEHICMPWETGISKTLNITSNLVSLVDFDVNKLKVVNARDNLPILLEILKLDDQVKILPTQEGYTKKNINLSDFLKAVDLDFTAIKIIDFPANISLSHSYLCNDNLYVPNCDKDQAKIHLNYCEGQSIRFGVELYHTNMMNSLCKIECFYKDGYIETNILSAHSNKPIQELHKTLQNHYQLSTTVNISSGIETDHKAISPLSNKPDYFESNLNFSVLKLEGLPENSLEKQFDIFFYNNAYYFTKSDRVVFEEILSKVPNNLNLTLSYYHHDTAYPIKQHMIKTDFYQDCFKKIA